MRKWYEWQLKNQVKNNNWPTSSTPIANVASDLKWFSKLVQEGYSNKILNSYFDNVFYRDDWVEKASNSTDGMVSKEELESWIRDERCSTLMDRQGVEYITEFDDTTDQKLKEIISNKLNLINESINFRVHIQRPGQFFALHFDRNKYGQFNIKNPNDDYETRSRIFLIFLNDREIGQSFHLGPAQLDWKAGDVFTWEQTDMPHGSSNCGLENRYSIILTGYQKLVSL